MVLSCTICTGVYVLKSLLSLLLILLLQASPLEAEKKIYQIIIKAIFPTKHIVRVWLDNPKAFAAILYLSTIKVVENPQKADILFISKQDSFSKISFNKIIFVNSYKLLKNYQNIAIGGFFWQKGRPNIVFLRRTLQKHHIHLPVKFQKYIEDKL